MLIFYHPETLEIKGMSDGDMSMSFPYIETSEQYLTTKNLAVELNNKGIPELKLLKG